MVIASLWWMAWIGEIGSQRRYTRNGSYRITCGNERKSSIKSLRRYRYFFFVYGSSCRSHSALPFAVSVHDDDDQPEKLSMRWKKCRSWTRNREKFAATRLMRRSTAATRFRRLQFQKCYRLSASQRCEWLVSSNFIIEIVAELDNQTTYTGFTQSNLSVRLWRNHRRHTFPIT